VSCPVLAIQVPLPALPVEDALLPPNTNTTTTTGDESAAKDPEPKQRELAYINWGPVPSTVIVKYNGLDWVWASPCLAGGCEPQISKLIPRYLVFSCCFWLQTFISILYHPPLTNTDIGQDGFFYATSEQWALRPAPSTFGPSSNFKCAARYFSYTYDFCGYNDAVIGAVFSEPCVGPVGSSCTGSGGIHPNSETWLVRDPRCVA
jgi:hypothetical protein